MAAAARPLSQQPLAGWPRRAAPRPPSPPSLTMPHRPLLVLSALGVAAAAPMADMIHMLPGWDGPLPSHHFSGYLNASSTKHLHYYFVESEGVEPSTAPTVLWFNGGPGCSSLDGLVYEHGPFHINSTSGGKTLCTQLHVCLAMPNSYGGVPLYQIATNGPGPR